GDRDRFLHGHTSLALYGLSGRTDQWASPPRLFLELGDELVGDLDIGNGLPTLRLVALDRRFGRGIEVAVRAADETPDAREFLLRSANELTLRLPLLLLALEGCFALGLLAGGLRCLRFAVDADFFILLGLQPRCFQGRLGPALYLIVPHQ